MKLVTFDLSRMHLHGTAFFDYLRLRKTFFVDKMNWDIPHNDDVEMDQYDTPEAFYSLVLKDGKVVGGGRAMSTSAKWGDTTYMLNDAAKGGMGTSPVDILPDANASESVWECTRLVVSDDLTTAAERSECLSLVVHGLVELSADRGAKELMSLSPITLMRALRSMGYSARQIGKSYMSFEDGRKYAVLKMPACNPVELAEIA